MFNRVWLAFRLSEFHVKSKNTDSLVVCARQIAWPEINEMNTLEIRKIN